MYDNVRMYRNHLLATIPEDELARLAPHLEPVPLERRRLLYDPERPIEHVYFIEHGIASILSVMADGSGIETGTIGAEGMIGMPVFHGMDRSAEQAMMQVSGAGHRVPAAAFREVLERAPTLVAMLHRFAVYMFTLAAQNSGCNRKHSVEERCARWLLTVHDRVQVDRFDLTHDFVSQMLGVRRASVTVTLGAFERAGLVRATRSRIEITDRARLGGVACECYGVVRAALERALGDASARSVLRHVRVSDGQHATTGDGTPARHADR
jgi:CRP-like cAMP-binding protein